MPSPSGWAGLHPQQPRPLRRDRAAAIPGWPRPSRRCGPASPHRKAPLPSRRAWASRRAGWKGCSGPSLAPARAYALDLRLAAARGRIEAGTEPLAAVARATGFSSAGTLARAFRSRYGISPSALRREADSRTLPQG
ncbi:helix-turn-helix domain-containing protein [Frigidibacter mobilis]|uniref:helix-turn-helix domain-containing protein n=1 Tax=Frigidibacter mobilis TaxID=1335048 RepID=UPI003AB080A9